MGGAAIGAGLFGDVLKEAQIIIEDGNIEAVASCGGAAIGAGAEYLLIADGDCNGSISINGGNIAMCLEDVEFGKHQGGETIAIIGHGYGGSKDGNLSIDNKLKVWFEGKDPVAQDKRNETCNGFSKEWLHIGSR